MSANATPVISLEQARELVQLLEMGENEEANRLMQQLVTSESSEIFGEVGRLTRQLHDSLADFKLDPVLTNLVQEDIPDAKNRLNYVIQMTENAANKTMDAVEASLPIADHLTQQLTHILPVWNNLMTRNLAVGEFKLLCGTLNGFLLRAKDDSVTLNTLLTDVLMAQDFQDLSGQILRRVIELVKEVEDNLVSLLTAFGQVQLKEQTIEKPVKTAETKADSTKAEGPVIDTTGRNDVVTSQDDVDDLLSSLGF